MDNCKYFPLYQTNRMVYLIGSVLNSLYHNPRGVVNEKPWHLQGARECGGPQSPGLGGPHVAEVSIAYIDVTAITWNGSLLPQLLQLFFCDLPP